ncbi:MAG: dihydroorotase [Hyphomicrobiales bacterium]
MNEIDGRRPLVLANARIVDPSRDIDTRGSVLVADGRIIAAGPEATSARLHGAEIYDCRGAVVAPGLIDMRVFVGEPGYEHRETLASASQAAAAGGVTTIVTMPDTDPVIDDIALVDYLFARARETSVVNVRPTAALTKDLKGEALTEIGLLKDAGAVAFTDGHRAVTSSRMLRGALTYARDFDALVVNNPQDPDLTGDGVMNSGETSTRLGLKGIVKEAEVIMVERDVRLARLTRGRYHAAQISVPESLEAIRRAKDEGFSVTCGTTINHLTLNELDIGPYRTFFKMSPPLRTEVDRKAMVAALAEGLIDVVVSAHDPQDVETKRHPFAEAADGAIGLETMLAAAMRLVHAGDIGLVQMLAAMSSRPARLLGLDAGTLKPGSPADIVVFDPDMPWVVANEDLKSRSKNTVFEGARMQGRVLRTLVAGKTVYEYPRPVD